MKGRWVKSPWGRIDVASGRLWTDVGVLPLSKTHQVLLAALLDAGPGGLSHEEADRAVWKKPGSATRLVVGIHRLRAAVGPSLIESLGNDGYRCVAEPAVPIEHDPPTVDPSWRGALRRLGPLLLTHERVGLSGPPGCGRQRILELVADVASEHGTQVIPTPDGLHLKGEVVDCVLQPRPVDADGANLTLSPWSARDGGRMLRKHLPGPVPVGLAEDLAVECGGLWLLLAALVEHVEAAGMPDPWKPVLPLLLQTSAGARFREEVHEEQQNLSADQRQARLDWLAGRGGAAERTGWPEPVPLPLAVMQPLPAEFTTVTTDPVALRATSAIGGFERYPAFREAVDQHARGTAFWRCSRLVHSRMVHADPQEQRELILIYTQTLRMAGEDRRALAVLRDHPADDPAFELRAATIESSLLDRLGRRDEANEVLAALEPRCWDVDERFTAQFLYFRIAHLPVGHPVEDLRRRIEELSTFGRPDMQAGALLHLARHEIAAGTDPDEVDALFARALTIAEACGVERLAPTVRGTWGSWLVLRQRRSKGRTLLKQAVADFERQSIQVSASQTRLFLALLDAEAGSTGRVGGALREQRSRPPSHRTCGSPASGVPTPCRHGHARSAPGLPHADEPKLVCVLLEADPFGRTIGSLAPAPKVSCHAVFGEADEVPAHLVGVPS